MGSTDALVTIQEERTPDMAAFPSAQRLRWSDGRVTEMQACIDTDAVLRQFRFGLGERGFYGWVALGPDVSAERRDEALGILEDAIACDPNSPEGDCV